jgi:predicted phage tail protein
MDSDTQKTEVEVSGAGGGGGGKSQPQTVIQQTIIQSPTAKQPVEAANNLFSVAFAKTVYALSEGEIEGFPNGIEKDVYLDGVPIRNPDNSTNFEGFTLDSRDGDDATQTPIPGFSQAENTVGVNVPVTQATGAVTRAITDTDTERARVIISHPALQAQNPDTGDINGTSVSYRIEVNSNGGAYTTVAQPTVSGKSNSEFQRAYEFALPGTGPWNLRVTRLTADSSSAFIQNSISWQAYVEIIDEKLAYPNTACVALKIDARQFNTIPDLSAKVRGKRVQVPTNYNAATRTYTGVWDGTFQMAWTDNPAWIFRDIVLNERFGVKRYVNSIAIDPWYLYTVSQYCDESVPNGSGGTEPRFTCNVYLQNPGSVYDVLNALASCFRGLIYYSEGELYLTQDRLQDPVQQFSEANVIQETTEDGRVSTPCFNYSGTARAARKTVVLANWDDPSQAYSSVTEYQQDDELLDKFGYNPVDLRLIGVTSRGQALRAAKHTLFSDRYETEKVSFRIGAEGLAAGVGEIIQIADPLRQGQRLGGRIVAIDGNTVTLDAVLALSPGTAYTLTLVVPDGETLTNGDGTKTTRPKLQVFNVVSSTEVNQETQEFKIQRQSTTDNLLTQDDDNLIARVVTSESKNTKLELNAVVESQTGALWVLEWSAMQAATFRIVSIAEVSPLIYQVEAIQYNASKYGFVDNDLPVAIPKDSFKLQQVTPPTNFDADLEFSNGQTSIKASWKAPQFNNTVDLLIKGYRYQWRKTGDTEWSDVVTVQATTVEIPLQNHVFGNSYQVRVATVNRLGSQSEFVSYDVDPFPPIPDLSAPEFGATLTHASQPDGTHLLIVDSGTCPIPERINGYRCWVKPQTLTTGEIPGVKPPNAEGWYFLADIPLTGYYTQAFHAPDTYDVRVNFTSKIFGEEPTDYIFDLVEREEITPPTPSNFGVVENQKSDGKRFSWQLPLSIYGSWDQSVVSDVIAYQVRFKKGTLATNVVEFDVSTDLISIKTGTVIGTKVNQHLFDIGDQVKFAASSGALPTGIVDGTTYFVAADGFSSVGFKVSATNGGAPISLSGTATGTYNVAGPASAKQRLDLQASWFAGIELASGGLPAQQQWFETSLFDKDTWCVMVKAVDATQWRSDVPAFVLVNIGAPPVSNAVQSVNAKTQAPGNWPGVKDNCEVSGGNLVQTNPELDSIFTWNFDNNNLESSLLLDTTSTATYQHKLVALTGNPLFVDQEDDSDIFLEDKPLIIDVGNNSFSLQQNGATISHGLVLNDTFEFIVVTGAAPTGVVAGTTYHVVATDLTDTTFRVATSQGGTAITLSGTASGTYAARGFQILAEQRFYSDVELAEGGIVHPYAPFEKLLGDVYRVETTFKSPDGGITAGNITELTAQLDYPDVIEKQNDVAISNAASGTAIPLVKPFRGISSVSITALQTTTNPNVVTAVVKAKTTSSVTVSCLNSSGNPVAGEVDITVIGF